MGLEYKVVSNSKAFELRMGDYVLDEDDDNVYIVSMIGYGGDDCALISIKDGGRLATNTTLADIENFIISNGTFQVYREGNIKIELSSPIYE